MNALTSEHGEKSPLKSKKFIAFLTWDLGFKALAVLILAWAWNLDEVSTQVFFLLLSIVVISGFVATGYILGQAGLDRFVRLAKIAAAKGTMNGSMAKVIARGTKGLIDAHESPATLEKDEGTGTVDDNAESEEEEKA